eukprot:jgi/Undpi1/10315/HiC_scaffold_28.g12766.m1
MKLLPNARGAFKNTLDRDQLALRNKIKASGGPKEQDAAAGSGTAAQAWSGDTHRSSTNNDNYVSTAPVPAPDPMDRPRRGGNKLPHTGQLKARGAVAVRRAVQEVVQAGVGSVAVVMAVRSERPTAVSMSLLRRPSVGFVQDFARGCKNPKMTQYSKRSQIGLYAGKDIRFGNTISFSNKKNRRTWKPNVQKKALYSEVLDDWVKFHLTTYALRCVDRAGGIDKYLLKTPDKWLNSVEGSNAKRQIQETLAARISSGELGGYAMGSLAEEEAVGGGSRPEKERQEN